ncbi:MAG: tetratricopeptide repeat protein [Spirochaetota bacterium]
MNRYKIFLAILLTAFVYASGFAQEEQKVVDSSVNTERMADQMKFDQGKYFFELGQYDRALENLQEYLELYLHGAHRGEAYRMIASVYFQRFRYNRAAEVYRSLLEEYPGSENGIQGMYKMGICYKKMGDTDRASAIFSRLIREYPSSSYAHHSRVILDVMKIVSSE